jgi:hypothetical protein
MVFSKLRGQPGEQQWRQTVRQVGTGDNYLDETVLLDVPSGSHLGVPCMVTVLSEKGDKVKVSWTIFLFSDQIDSLL